jgi:hypothetical protein
MSFLMAGIGDPLTNRLLALLFTDETEDHDIAAAMVVRYAQDDGLGKGTYRCCVIALPPEMEVDANDLRTLLEGEEIDPYMRLLEDELGIERLTEKQSHLVH